MLTMAKEKKTFQFLFSTTDLNFDPSTVEVRDSKTGKILKVDSKIEIVDKRKVKVFGLRMTEGDIDQIHEVAEKANIHPAEFGRQAVAKAVQEAQEDLKRLKKN